MEPLDINKVSGITQDQARSASVEQIPTLIHDHREEVLRGLMENPHFKELHLYLLLGRVDLSTLLLEEIARHEQLIASYRVSVRLRFTTTFRRPSVCGWSANSTPMILWP